MSEDDFLKRWSRRKREAADVANAAPAVESRSAETAPDNQPAQGKLEKPEVEFDPASLPPIDSINAITDVSAFLRAGVPAELTRAALRRVWTADPAIRDFVGLAENAWDFTDPNAMPGFGPLESTEEVRRMIADLVDKIGRMAQPIDPAGSPETTEIAENLNDSNVINPPGEDRGASDPAAAVSDSREENPAQILGNTVLVQSNKEYIATQRDDGKASTKPRQSLRRPHGSALPR